jgi:CheY-like chemotaxis protein
LFLYCKVLAHNGRVRNLLSLFPRMHVLLVEDDAVLADGLTRSLQGHGMQVELAGDGLQADLQLQRNPPQVAVLDIGLPGIDGFEVVRRLRARAVSSRTGVVSPRATPSKTACAASSSAPTITS